MRFSKIFNLVIYCQLLFFVMFISESGAITKRNKNISDGNIEISGNMDGKWTDPTPDGDSPAFSGLGTSYFSYGKPGDNGAANTLEWIGNSFISLSNIPFKLGTIKYYNGTTKSGTCAKDVLLNLSLIVNSPISIDVVFPFRLELVSVKNTDDAEESADYVYFPNTYPEQTIVIDSVLYKLELIGFSNDGGQSKVQEFHVLEDHKTSADLYGWITKVTEANLTNIEINGPGDILIGNNAIYRCNAFYDDGMVRNITEVAHWSSNCENSQITSSGIFTFSGSESNYCSITASYQNHISEIEVNLLDKNEIGDCKGLYTEEDMKKMINSILSWGDTDKDGKIGLSEAIIALLINTDVLKCSALKPEACLNEEDCNKFGKWIDNSCHKIQPCSEERLEFCFSEESCVSVGGIWCNPYECRIDCFKK